MEQLLKNKNIMQREDIKIIFSFNIYKKLKNKKNKKEMKKNSIKEIKLID